MRQANSITITIAVALAALIAQALGGCSSGGGGGGGGGGNAAATFMVTDTAGDPVASATVHAIPATDVEALAAIAISRDADNFGNYSAEGLTVDEPLEDLINGNFTPSGSGVAVYKKGVTASNGQTQIAGLGGTDMFFIYVQTDSADPDHLPGGSLCRTAVSGASLGDGVNEITVSTRPSATAVAVGTTTCLTCHVDKVDMLKTAHKHGIMVPGAPSNLQDTSYFDGDDGVYNMFAGLDKFTGGGTTVYFYDYDSTRKFDKFKTSETDPTAAGGVVWATVRVFQNAGDYMMEFTNIKNPGDPRSPFTKKVELTYGGGVWKQRYMTTAGSSIHMLPLQFNTRGDEAAVDRVRRQWRDYHMDWWIAGLGGTPTFKEQPAHNNAADLLCASCHFNSFNLTQNSGGEFMASGVADANGEIHPVTGEKQELNIGCETCHGPGSEHVAAAPGGKGVAIVSPQHLPPERESAICAQCHSRSQGKDGFAIHKDAPLDSNNRMMVPGMSRADFLATHTSRHDSAATDMWGDGLHSKSHHQQYTDFIQSRKYRNGVQLLTCASCHDLHAPGDHPTDDRHQLTGANDDSLCLSCHDLDSEVHQVAKTGQSLHAISGARCIDCHTAKTANSGAGRNQTATEGFVDPSTGTLRFHGDISSHVFDVPAKESAPMPVPFTSPNAGNVGVCGVCHSGFPG